MNIWRLSVYIFSSLILCGCDSVNKQTEFNTDGKAAAITAVNFTGEPGNYIFSVTVESPDSGCEQYANWWEVIRPNGTLVYRRILTHSHVTEQPFTRNGGPVNVAADTEVIVRAHMNSNGYGEQVFRGSIVNGFIVDSLNSSFSAELELIDPLPSSCAF